MAKRFIDTKLFDDEWFMDLSKDAKLFYIYLFTNCDHAGIIKLNEKLITFQTGISNIAEALNELGSRCISIKDAYFIPKYINFQYPNFPRSSVKQQESAINILKTIGIWDNIKQYGINTIEKEINTARQRLSQKAKDKIIERDEFQCQYCSKQFEKTALSVDHILPVILGGENEDENLITACLICNSTKSDLSPKEFLSKSYDSKCFTEKAFNMLNTVNKNLNKCKQRVINSYDNEHDNDNDIVNEHDKEGEYEREKIIKDAAYLVRNIWGKNPVGVDISSTNKLIDHFGFDECNIAFRKSHKQNAKSFSYVEKILKNRAKVERNKKLEEVAKQSEADHNKVKADDNKKYDFSKDKTFQELLKKVDTKKPKNGNKKKKDFGTKAIKQTTPKAVDESDPEYQKSKREFQQQLKLER